MPARDLRKSKLVERRLAEVSPETGKLRITSRGFGRLERLVGASERQQKRVKALFPYPWNAELLGALVKRFVGRNLRGKKFLELGCRDYHGTGPSFLVALAKQGAHAHGIDLAETGFINELSSKALRDRMRFVRGDIAELDRHFEGELYDSVVSRNLLEDGVIASEAGKDKLLRDISAKLKPGGHFIFMTVGTPLFSRDYLEKHGFRVIVFTNASQLGLVSQSALTSRGLSSKRKTIWAAPVVVARKISRP